MEQPENWDPLSDHALPRSMYCSKRLPRPSLRSCQRHLHVLLAVVMLSFWLWLWGWRRVSLRFPSLLLLLLLLLVGPEQSQPKFPLIVEHAT